MRKISAYLKLYILALMVALGLLGCGKADSTTSEASQVNVFYLNKENTMLVSEAVELNANELSGQIKELIELMRTMPDSLDERAPLMLGSDVIDVYMDGRQLVINMDEKYKNLTSNQEILLRAALVRVFTQLDDIDAVCILIRDEALKDEFGNPIGSMTADMFVDNEGSEINAYENGEIVLYFASEDGKELVKTTRRVEYSSNISLEKVVFDELIKGPVDSGAYPTINPQVNVNSVTVADGVCYIDISGEFLINPYNVTAQVQLYSVVNTITEITGINKVVILINGDNSYTLRETISLDGVFERNLDIVRY